MNFHISHVTNILPGNSGVTLFAAGPGTPAGPELANHILTTDRQYLLSGLPVRPTTVASIRMIRYDRLRIELDDLLGFAAGGARLPLRQTQSHPQERLVVFCRMNGPASEWQCG